MAKTITLPSALVEELKVWKMAFNASYGKEVSYGEMIRSMLDSLEVNEPSVVEELGHILEKHPCLDKNIANYESDRIEK